ncbi:hypothetical protein H2203_002043 [Taxawa tesnikishii (nom. ined.)]|nr:hypothetical protein H2203_002043 [Dothideales sp. JES 119]
MNLTNFYKKELSESAGGNPVNPYMDSNYGSPGNLARIVQMFGGLPMAALKKMREKPQPMREAQSPAEGLSLLSSDADSEIIHKMQDLGWDSAITTEQRTSYSFNYNARFTDELWPVSTLLRTRRQKRCRNCRNILLKPDPKMGSSKHQIRLLALSHIPKLSLRAFTPGSSPIPPLSFTFATTLTKPTSTYDYDHIRPFAPIHFLLTLTNPLFDSVRITLATPATTPGKVQSKVTILCPSFEIGAGGDVWDEALDASKSASRLGTGRDAASGREEDRQPEAGKIWDRGRNWTSVVVEVVPGSLTPASGSLMEAVQQREKGDTGGQGNGGGRGEKRVDEDVLEIPVFVRVEWEAEAVGEGAVKGEKEARELAFWSVLGAGRIFVALAQHIAGRHPPVRVPQSILDTLDRAIAGRKRVNGRFEEDPFSNVVGNRAHERFAQVLEMTKEILEPLLFGEQLGQIRVATPQALEIRKDIHRVIIDLTRDSDDGAAVSQPPRKKRAVSSAVTAPQTQHLDERPGQGRPQRQADSKESTRLSLPTRHPNKQWERMKSDNQKNSDTEVGGEAVGVDGEDEDILDFLEMALENDRFQPDAMHSTGFESSSEEGDATWDSLSQHYSTKNPTTQTTKVPSVIDFTGDSADESMVPKRDSRSKGLHKNTQKIREVQQKKAVMEALPFLKARPLIVRHILERCDGNVNTAVSRLLDVEDV